LIELCKVALRVSKFHLPVDSQGERLTLECVV
jgi:hypothetical protein